MVDIPANKEEPHAEHFAKLREAWDSIEIRFNLHHHVSPYAIRVECFKPSYQQHFYGGTLNDALDAAVQWVRDNPKERTYA